MDINSDSQDKKIIEELITKKIKFYKLESIINDEKRANELRLKAIEKILNKKFSHIRNYSMSPQNTRPNIENMIGAVQVPLGIAGPLKLSGKFAKGNFFLPLATTEGALTASINRGCSVIKRSDGANVRIIKSGQTRSILFKFSDIGLIPEFIKWLKDNFSQIKQVAERKSNFLELQKIDKFIVGDTLWLKITADSKDAMGMNMITLAARSIGDYIEKNYEGIRFISSSGNLCMDKKPSAVNLYEGRGKMLVADVYIDKDTVKKYLKVSSKKIIEVNYRKNILGSALAGSYGFNANFANIIAAIFLATGQDLGHVVEGSHGFTTMEIIDKKLHVMVTLSSLQLGTVGGGTNLETQKECLEMLGVHGSGKVPGENASKFAEIVAGTVLAGEISLVGALAAKHLIRAHLEHNR
ncbi:hydroxymethylglutaryl-CoA reductase (NADPH) [Candidatus Woesearchaeota archaeon]|nr:hydroxymethylglutaryl-CoA reductase (NADPH) [Candidatus Woesearchaeota archaeon]